MQALLNMLVSCFGRRMTVNGQFVRALKRSLPSDLTAAQGEELGLRLVQRCTFAPTVAEILSEWRTMRGEMRRRAAVTAPAPIGRKTAVPQKVRDIRHFLQQRQPLPKGEAVPAGPAWSWSLTGRSALSSSSCPGRDDEAPVMRRAQMTRLAVPWRPTWRLFKEVSACVRLCSVYECSI